MHKISFHTICVIVISSTVFVAFLPLIIISFFLIANYFHQPELLTQCTSPDGQYSAELWLERGSDWYGKIIIIDLNNGNSRNYYTSGFDESCDLTGQYHRLEPDEKGFTIIDDVGLKGRHYSWDIEK